MRSLFRNVVAGLIAVAMASGVAYAQDEGDGSAAPPPPGAEEGSGGYPQEIIARPLTLPMSAWQASLAINTNESFDGIGTTLGFLYGVSDKLNAGVQYGFTLDPSEFKGPLLVDVLFSFLTDDSMEAVATGQVGYDLLAEGLAPLQAGVLVQYNLNDKMAIITPGNQLFVTLDPIQVLDVEVSPIFIQLPVAFGYQVNNQIYAEAGTNLGIIEISDADTQFIFADFIPIAISGFFSPDNTIDVGASLSTDLKNDAFDPLEILLIARYRGGV